MCCAVTARQDARDRRSGVASGCHVVAKRGASRFHHAVTSPTIYDVARTAGVATSTVSRAFSNPQRVGEATRELVLRTARELGYEPNPHARALRRAARRPSRWCCPTSPTRTSSRSSAVRSCARRPRPTRSCWSTPRSHRASSRSRSSGWPARWTASSSRPAGCPTRRSPNWPPTKTLVLVNRQVRGIRSVVLEQGEGCRQLVAHLASLGHTSIAYLAGPRHSWMAASRWSAIRDAAAELGDLRRPDGPVHAEGRARRRRGRRRADDRGDRDDRAQRPPGHRRPAPARRPVGPGARGRQRGRVRRHLRRRAVHPEPDHAGRRARRPRPGGGGAAPGGGERAAGQRRHRCRSWSCPRNWYCGTRRAARRRPAIPVRPGHAHGGRDRRRADATAPAGFRWAEGVRSAGAAPGPHSRRAHPGGDHRSRSGRPAAVAAAGAAGHRLRRPGEPLPLLRRGPDPGRHPRAAHRRHPDRRRPRRPAAPRGSRAPRHLPAVPRAPGTSWTSRRCAGARSGSTGRPRWSRT